MTALTKEQIDALPGLVERDIVAIANTTSISLMEWSPICDRWLALSATVIEQQAEIERLREALEAEEIALKNERAEIEDLLDEVEYSREEHRKTRAELNEYLAFACAIGNIAHAMKDQPE